MDPLYDKGCAQWVNFLSPSPLLKIFQPEAQVHLAGSAAKDFTPSLQ